MGGTMIQWSLSLVLFCCPVHSDQGNINEIHDVIILATFTAVLYAPGLPVNEKYKCGSN